MNLPLSFEARWFFSTRGLPKGSTFIVLEEAEL